MGHCSVETPDLARILTSCFKHYEPELLIGIDIGAKRGGRNRVSQYDG